MRFHDHFSSIAAHYAAFRPTYPDDLFVWLKSEANEGATVWDCACGNGQASVGLAEHFDHVIATDASVDQIKTAQPNPKIYYGVAPAEKSGFPDHSIDLITVAQALHWFDFDAFYTEARRVMKPRGIIAVWCCGAIRADIDAVTARLEHFHHDVLGPYWPPQTKFVDDAYRSIPFPFDEVPSPQFKLEASWELAHVLGYFRSFSATKEYVKQNARDPVELIETELKSTWGDPQQPHRISWPFHLRIGRA